MIDQEDQYLVPYIAALPALHAALSSCNHDVSFDAGWCIVRGIFESLKNFIGVIVSVFPGTDQVDREFSILKMKKDDFRSSLTDLSPEGILHSKQYAMLASL